MTPDMTYSGRNWFYTKRKMWPTWAANPQTGTLCLIHPQSESKTSTRFGCGTSLPDGMMSSHPTSVASKFQFQFCHVISDPNPSNQTKPQQMERKGQRTTTSAWQLRTQKTGRNFQIWWEGQQWRDCVSGFVERRRTWARWEVRGEGPSEQQQRVRHSHPRFAKVGAWTQKTQSGAATMEFERGGVDKAHEDTITHIPSLTITYPP